MKIIKHGKLKSSNRKANCRNCGCRFEFNSTTEGKYEWDQREQGGFWRLKCPQPGCGNEVIAYE